ncbi:MAG: hypothetical protein M1818_006712 [Claussenomyces sp. TS43310]|nr:MAG: hypothetical protein M1818_006712 [Claussenomyces sp. TS43310]
MSYELDLQKLEHAFQGRPDIIGAIRQAADAPNWVELFNEISRYVSDLRLSATPSEPASKKRKVDATLPINSAPDRTASNGNAEVVKIAQSGGASLKSDDEGASLLQIRDISFVVPQRKKYTVDFTQAHIRARHLDTGEIISNINYAWKDIAYAFCLPVPEKAQKQYNYILFPSRSNIPSKGAPTMDPLVFTIPATAPKAGAISGPEASTASSFSDTHKDVFDHYISHFLAAAAAAAARPDKVSLVEAEERQFASSIKEAHRPADKALFTKAFRGSKDGYLFFLSTGIFFGFKKPLLFLPKEHIVAVSYTSVLQRTFNLSVEVYTDADAVAADADADADAEDRDELEFAMLDQEDFAGLDAYVKRHGLQDASMADQRRAKRLGVNAVKARDGTVLDAGDAGELERAQQALEDEEDEEEEDYDPGSEGESEGSGTSSGDEDEDADDDDDGGGGEDVDDDDDEHDEEQEEGGD